MEAFDFDAAEEAFRPVFTLRQRATEAWGEQKAAEERELLIAAHETLHELLGETHGLDVHVDRTTRTVTMIVDHVRLRVEVKNSGCELRMATSRSGWSIVNEIADVGRLIDQYPDCMVEVPGEPAPPTRRVGPPAYADACDRCVLTSECDGSCAKGSE